MYLKVWVDIKPIEFILYDDELHINHNEHHVIVNLFDACCNMARTIYPDNTIYYKIAEDYDNIDDMISEKIGDKENIGNILINLVKDADELSVKYKGIISKRHINKI